MIAAPDQTTGEPKVPARARLGRLRPYVAWSGWVVAGILAGIMVGQAVAASGRQVAAPVATIPRPGSNGAAPAAGGRGFTGKVSEITADGFSMITLNGSTVQVTIGASTKFGTKTKPESRDQLRQGSRVRVAGTRHAGTIQANRVVILGGAPSPLSTPSPSA